MKTWNSFQIRSEQLLSDPINSEIVDMIKYYSEGEGMEEKLKKHNQKLAEYNSLHWFFKFFMRKPYHHDYMEFDELSSRIPLPDNLIIKKIKLLEASGLLKPICWEHEWGEQFLTGVTTSGCKALLAAGER